jgi:hypothetical protein
MILDPTVILVFIPMLSKYKKYTYKSWFGKEGKLLLFKYSSFDSDSTASYDGSVVKNCGPLINDMLVETIRFQSRWKIKLSFCSQVQIQLMLFLLFLFFFDIMLIERRALRNVRRNTYAD